MPTINSYQNLNQKKTFEKREYRFVIISLMLFGLIFAFVIMSSNLPPSSTTINTSEQLQHEQQHPQIPFDSHRQEQQRKEQADLEKLFPKGINSFLFLLICKQQVSNH